VRFPQQQLNSRVVNWRLLRPAPWLDTRARFVAATPQGGTLLDIGSSDGQTLGHIAELRPDLRLFATDIAGEPEKFPPSCQFHRGDIQQSPLPWVEGSMDAITCMHLVEHLQDMRPLMREAARLLRPGGRVYFETPHPKTLNVKSISHSGFTLNFHDDPTHVRLVTTDELGKLAASAGLQVEATGISRNWLFAASYPLFALLPARRSKYIAYVHWLGWSAFLMAHRPA
jgi:SAM-dependent methyltransferase